MDKSDIVKWVKENKDFLIKYGTIIIIGIPLSIYVLLWIPIPTNHSTDGDWLGFWGSFLGSIIGGIATLIGVVMTLRYMNDETNKIEEGRDPFLIPLEKVVHCYIDNKNQMKYFNNEKVNTGDKLKCEVITINILNAGEKHSMGVTYYWIPPKGFEICDYLVSQGLQVKYRKYFYTQSKIINKKNYSNIQIIMSGKVYSDDGIRIGAGLETYIRFVIENIIMYHKKSDYMISYNDIPLGTMVLSCYDVYGKNIERYYKMNMYLGGSTHEMSKEISHYGLIIRFRLLPSKDNDKLSGIC